MAVKKGSRGLAGGGMANPMTTAGDLIRGGTAGAPTRVAVGTTGQVLTVAAGVPGWADPAGIDTSLQAAPDTGWTAAGDGTAAIAAGVATFTVTAAQASAVLRRTQNVCSVHLPAVEVIARVTVTSAPSGNHFTGIGVSNADIPANGATFRGLIVQSQPDGNTYLFVNSAGSFGVSGNVASPATLASGELWQRLVYSAGGVTAFVGAGPTIPSSWTEVATTAPQHLLSGPGTVTQIMAFAGRAAGTGDMVVDIEDIQWRSLLGYAT
jgi:hypothetical protein